MLHVRLVKREDKEFWFCLDRHLSEAEFANKVRDGRGYVLLEDQQPIGLLRYNLFWDQHPFCTMLFVEQAHRGKGGGKALIARWEADMRTKGYGMVMTSTQVDEDAQHFYRKLGYQDCGGLVIHAPAYAQPMELFLMKVFSPPSRPL